MSDLKKQIKPKCPECGMPIGWTGQWPIQVTPKPGDMAMCAGCKKFFFYGEDGLRRKATAEERQQYHLDEPQCPRCFMPVAGKFHGINTDDPGPTPGCAVICECQTMLVMREDKSWRLATKAEFKTLDAETRQRIRGLQQQFTQPHRR